MVIYSRQLLHLDLSTNLEQNQIQPVSAQKWRLFCQTTNRTPIKYLTPCFTLRALNENHIVMTYTIDQYHKLAVDAVYLC